MSGLHFLSVLRRRWPILVLCVGIMLAPATFFSRRAPGPEKQAKPVYSASAILLGTAARGVGNLETLSTLVTVGDVLERAAAALGNQDPVEVAQRVRSSSDTRTGLLTITVTGDNPREAEHVANVFAQELISFVAEERQKEVEAQISLLDRRRDQVESELRDLRREATKAAGARAGNIESSILQREQEITGIDSNKMQLSGASVFRAGAPQLVQKARSQRLPTSASADGVSSAMLYPAALVVGLASGLTLLLILERLDSRIRTKAAAEEQFGFPVLTEVPLLGRRQRRLADSIANTEPSSLAADAYRLLALSLVSAGSGRGNWDQRGVQDHLDTTGSRASSPSPLRPSDASALQPATGGRTTSALGLLDAPTQAPAPPRTILITSPLSGDGKTTVAENLAVSLSEMGRKVALVSWDPQRRKLGAVPMPDQAIKLDASARGNERRADNDLIAATAIERIDIGLIARSRTGEPTEELRSSHAIEHLLTESKRDAEIVIIDTSSLLDGSDAAALATHVDAVVVVARAGKTEASQAQRTTQLLTQLGAPMRGLVLNAVKEMTMWSPERRRSRR